MADPALISYLKGFGRALGPDLIGGPVDLAREGLNLGIAGVNFAGTRAGVLKQPLPTIQPGAVGDSDWWARLTQVPDDGSASYTAGRMTPLGAAVVRTGVPAAARVVDAMLAKRARAPLPSRSGPAPTAKDQLGAIVWHGSPYKFDKFDSSKIGTGEGAQSYGHGLYVAGNPATAEFYKQKLQDSAHSVLHKTIQAEGWPQDFSDRMFSLLHYNKFTPQEAAQVLSQTRLGERIGQQRLAEVAAKAVAAKPQPGHLYEIDLPDSAIANMFDWDKRFSAQPAPVRQAVETAMQTGLLDKDSSKGIRDFDSTGGALYKFMALDHPKRSGDAYRGSAEVAEFLRSQGVPGVRYLDDGSRAAGAGTSNYVVFPGNEDLLRILRRHSVAP